MDQVFNYQVHIQQVRFFNDYYSIALISSAANTVLFQMARKDQTFTTAFPTFSPRSIPINAFGMFSNPSVTVSRYTSFPYNQTDI